MSKVVLVGKEQRSYIDKKTGEVKNARTIYVMYEPPKQQIDGMVGQKCEALFCGFDINSLNVNSCYELNYEITNSRSGSFARLVGLTPCEEI